MCEPVSDIEKRRIDFMPGELVFLVEHTTPLSHDALRERILVDLPQNTDDRVRQAINISKSERIFTFQRPEISSNALANFMVRLLRLLRVDARIGSCEPPMPFFSVMFTTVKNGDDREVADGELLQMVRSLDHQIASKQFTRRHRRQQPQRRLLRPVRRASTERKASNYSSQETGGNNEQQSDDSAVPDFAVMAASPNWMMSSAQSQTVTGGPGSEPEPTSGQPLHQYATNLPATASAITEYGVDVYILDTVPSATGQDPDATLKAAYKRWVTDQPAASQHSLLKTMLEPTGTGFKYLEIITDDTMREDGTPLMPYLNDHFTGACLEAHQYCVTDHGLFVAGIIHSIAPEARLHLVQVLNDYGVGTTETLLRGLLKVLEAVLKKDSQTRTIVNCSLMIDVPLKDHPVMSTDPAVLRTWEDMRAEVSPLDRMGWLAEWVCDLLFDHDAVVVMAAGNDAQSKSRPQARYPAAFTSVIGVASSGADPNTPAIYSNRADRPESSGFITFGGDADLVSAGGTRPASIYIGDFPNGSSSTNGWAYWSGTSFAAPVISGTLAKLYRQHSNKAKVVDEMLKVSLNSTNDDEVIFHAHLV
jgi:hypothetical protein